MPQEGNEGAEATPADAGAEATPEGSKEGQQVEQKQGAHFSDNYDEDVRAIASRYTTEAEMAKALKSANAELSSRIKPPGENASEEDIAKFRKQMGVPDDISGYAIQRPEFMDEATFNSAGMKASIGGIVGKMHDAGASKAVVDATMEAYWALEAAGKEQTAKMDTDAAAAAEAHLRKEWDKNYDANMSFAEQAAEKHPDLANLELKDGTLVGSNPHFAKALAELGRISSEGGPQLGLINSEAGVDLKTRFDELTNDISVAYNSGDKMKAQRLDNERQELSKKLFGDRPISGQAGG